MGPFPSFTSNRGIKHTIPVVDNSLMLNWEIFKEIKDL